MLNFETLWESRLAIMAYAVIAAGGSWWVFCELKEWWGEE